MIGTLNKRVKIQTKTISQGTTGEFIETWADTATRWAAIEPLEGREYWQAQQLNTETTAKITIRHYPGLTTVNRIKFGSRYFDIVSVQNQKEGNKYTVLMCKEVI